VASGAPSHSRDGIGSVISARIEAWGGAELPLERLTFGTTEPDAIAAAIDAWCRGNLGAGIAQYHFFDSSSGSVHGVRLRDGRDVVVKVHRPDLTLAYLDAISTVQRAFAERGLPASRPLTGPVPYGPVHITAETMLESGQPADGHDPTVRAALARGLARVAVVGRAMDLDGIDALHHPTAMPPDALYPPPHSARFDFDATAAGAEWIDAYARRARTVLATADPGPDVLVHGDWRIENANVAGGEVVAIYDWDSVCVEPELYAVATSSVTFCVDWSRPVGEHFPTNAEIRAFIGEYEIARGAPFSDAQRGLLAARIVYGLSYGARCEHAVNYPEVADSQQALLRRLADPLLDHGLDALRSE
jgi:Ser/Thr protein kinase RdoA (MazF antagonist)